MLGSGPQSCAGVPGHRPETQRGGMEVRSPILLQTGGTLSTAKGWLPWFQANLVRFAAGFLTDSGPAFAGPEPASLTARSL